MCIYPLEDKVSGYDEMVDIGHLSCPGLDRVGSTPTNRKGRF